MLILCVCVCVCVCVCARACACVRTCVHVPCYFIYIMFEKAFFLIAHLIWCLHPVPLNNVQTARIVLSDISVGGIK